MSITASQIREVGFEHALRGYDVKQVDDFLDKCAEGVDEMRARIAELEGAAGGAPAPDASVQADVCPPAGGDTAEPASVEPAESTLTDGVPAAQGLVAADVDAAAFKALEAQLAERDARIAELEAQLAEKAASEHVISEAFISAQRSAEQLKDEARQEGARIYTESENKARELIRGALVAKQRVLDEVEVLKGSRDDFRAQYIALIDNFKAAADDFASMSEPQVSEEAVNAMLSEQKSAANKIPDPKEDPEQATGPMEKAEPASIDFDPLPTAEMERVKFSGDTDSPFDDIEEYV